MPDAVHWTDYAIQSNYVLEHRKYKAIISIPKTFFAKNVIFLIISPKVSLHGSANFPILQTYLLLSSWHTSVSWLSFSHG